MNSPQPDPRNSWSSPKGDILLVDDALPNLRVLSTMLTEQGYEVRGAPDGPTALMIISAEPPDVILLDIVMPGMDGYEVCQRLKRDAKTRDIPVIFLSALDEVVDKVKGFAVGGVDYITKPFQIEEVLVRITTHLRLRELTERMEQQVRERTNELTIAVTEAKRLNQQLEQEIAERVRAEEALRDSEERYRGLFEGVPVGLYRSMPAGHILNANPVLVQMLGYPDREALLTINATDLYVNPEVRKQWQALMEREGVVRDFEVQMRRRDGTTIWVRNSGRAVRDVREPQSNDGEGRVLYYEGSLKDITERKQAEEALRESELQHSTTLDAMADMIHVVDTDLRFVLVNKKFKERNEEFGLETDVINRTIFGVFPFLPDGVRDEYYQVFDSGEMLITEESTEVGGVEILTETRKIPVFEGGRAVRVVTVVRDITERKRAEAEREALIAELEAKNAELERFTYTVSHDLKSPLITIRGFLGFLEQAAMAGNVERVKADMTRISNATDKMHQLLDELLELSRIGRLMNPPQEVPLGELAREAVSMVASRLAERGVEVAIAPDLPVVYGDRPRLREVLENLVDNAVKFMGDQPDPRVEIGMRRDGAERVFYVRDNGVGIDPQYHDKVFGLFEKLDPKAEGTGVGLAIVKRIVEVHGGRLWVESEGGGQGSTFCFTLPDQRTLAKV